MVMALEGGFELEALCNCTEACVRTLLEDTNGVKLSEEAINSRPNNNAVNTIREVASVLSKYHTIIVFDAIRLVLHRL